MSPEKEPSVTAAVRELRVALGESQQAFAQRLKAAVRTIARYETVRPPRGKPLAQLHRLAVSENLHDIAAVLQVALVRDLYGDVGPSEPDPAQSTKRARNQEFITGVKEDAQRQMIMACARKLADDKRFKDLQKPFWNLVAPIVKELKKEAEQYATKRSSELENPRDDSK